jgi:hypothetical protein
MNEPDHEEVVNSFAGTMQSIIATLRSLDERVTALEETPKNASFFALQGLQDRVGKMQQTLNEIDQLVSNK